MRCRLRSSEVLWIAAKSDGEFGDTQNYLKSMYYSRYFECDDSVEDRIASEDVLKAAC